MTFEKEQIFNGFEFQNIEVDDLRVQLEIANKNLEKVEFNDCESIRLSREYLGDLRTNGNYQSFKRTTA